MYTIYRACSGITQMKPMVDGFPHVGCGVTSHPAGSKMIWHFKDRDPNVIGHHGTLSLFLDFLRWYPLKTDVHIVHGVQDHSPKDPSFAWFSFPNHIKFTPSLVPSTPNPGPSGSRGPWVPRSLSLRSWPGLKVWRRSVARLDRRNIRRHFTNNIV